MASIRLTCFIYPSPSEGMVLLENPKGDNKLDVEKLKMVCRTIFNLNNTPLAIFNEATGKTGLFTVAKHHYLPSTCMQ